MNWAVPNAQEASYCHALQLAMLERQSLGSYTLTSITAPEPDRRLNITLLQNLYDVIGLDIVSFVNPNKVITTIYPYYSKWTLSEALEFLYPSNPIYPYPQAFARDNSAFVKTAHDLINLMLCTVSDLNATFTAAHATSDDRDWINLQGPDYVGWGRGGFDNQSNNLAVNLSVTGTMLEGTPNTCSIRVWNFVGPDPGFTDARSGFSVTVPPGYTLSGVIDSTNLPIGNIILQTYSPAGGTPTGWQSSWISTGAGGANNHTSSSALPSGNSDGTTFTGHASTLTITGQTTYPANMAPIMLDIQAYVSGSGPDGFIVPGLGWKLNAWNTIGTVTVTPSAGSPQLISFVLDVQPTPDTSSVYNWGIDSFQIIPDPTSFMTLNPHNFQFHP
jgi:hypothetical protein